MFINVRVTKKEISNGVQLEGSACPIYLSLAKKGATELFVGSDFIYNESPTTNWAFTKPVAKLPKKAQKFIDDFDADRESVRPISFKFRISKKNARAIGLIK